VVVSVLGVAVVLVVEVLVGLVGDASSPPVTGVGVVTGGGVGAGVGARVAGGMVAKTKLPSKSWLAPPGPGAPPPPPCTVVDWRKPG